MRPEFIILLSLLSWHFNLLYSLLNETLWNIQTPTWRRSLCVGVFAPSVFLHIPECVSAVLDLSISDDKHGNRRDRHGSTPANRHDSSRHCDLLFRSVPSQLMMSQRRIRLNEPQRDVVVGWVCWPYWASSSLIGVPLSLFLSLSASPRARR